MDTKTLQTAYRDFVTVAQGGTFAAPPAGEWTAAQILAHIVAADTGITSIALGVASGQRPSYDNRYSLDPWNLARLIDQSQSDLPGLVELVQLRGRLLCDIAELLSASELDTPVHCLILSGCEVMADTAQPLGRLIQGVGAVHLPRHADQLAGLRTTAA